MCVAVVRGAWRETCPRSPLSSFIFCACVAGRKSRVLSEGQVLSLLVAELPNSILAASLDPFVVSGSFTARGWPCGLVFCARDEELTS